MDELDFTKAITALKKGEVIVYPTDTLYGLGADIYNKDAIRKVFEIKKRPTDNPLPVAVSDIDGIEKIAFLDEKSRSLIERFLPGKLTIVFKKKSVVPDTVTGGLRNIAIRIPDDKIALRLLSEFGPLTATSANIHGKKTPSVIKDIKMQFKERDIAVYLDVGRLEDRPSTIVDATGRTIKIIREGTISKKEIMGAI
jgi:L-threonylcarbamoyladenylate synthase